MNKRRALGRDGRRGGACPPHTRSSPYPPCLPPYLPTALPLVPGWTLTLTLTLTLPAALSADSSTSCASRRAHGSATTSPLARARARMSTVRARAWRGTSCPRRCGAAWRRSTCSRRSVAAPSARPLARSGRGRDACGMAMGWRLGQVPWQARRPSLKWGIWAIEERGTRCSQRVHLHMHATVRAAALPSANSHARCMLRASQTDLSHPKREAYRSMV